ncbi:hypothetical protein KM043_015199 [Ampulex compressa]|nr:hypothetical protein KM043_015199 [Ampulex compressa]
MAEQCLNNEDVGCRPPKERKLEAENVTDDDDGVHTKEINMSTFEMARVLHSNHMRKQIWIEGTFKGHDNPAIVCLEKTVFPADELLLKEGFLNEDTTLQKVFRNDIYGNYVCFPIKEHNGLNAIVIHPATPKHIEKFQKKELHIINETYEIYQNITLPYINSHSFSLDWVYNILEHKAEVENIIYEDTDKEHGFILVTDLKWDRQLSTLKLLALPFKKILCIRELNASHLPLLKNIRDAGTAAIAKKFKVPASQLRIYLHYQPSYYYLHVHFSYLMCETPGIYVEKAHLLSTVIGNIEIVPDYYAKAVLSYVVAEGDPLFAKFQEKGLLCETKVKSITV